VNIIFLQKNVLSVDSAALRLRYNTVLLFLSVILLLRVKE